MAQEPGPAPTPIGQNLRVIRTPDQRLRVFVSSTLQELAPERAAARAAIDRLRLVPVMFELGARPHPPAELYRAYLEQSHVFVGLYWQRYGWVAPDMEVSGLEDEWNLAADHPKLVYLKHPAPDREGRLDELLGRIRDDGSTSYRAFSTTEELRELLETDLAVLLSERFEEAGAHDGTGSESTGRADPATVPAAHVLPSPPTRLIGRDVELATLRDLITEPDARLVTITGPGGSGKTRLAVELGTRLRDDLGWHVALADLTGLRTAALVLPTIAAALGVKEGGDRSLAEATAVVLGDREVIAVVDNFEHVIDTAAGLADLLAAAPGLRLIVTSRQALRLRWEREYPLSPLELPAGDGPGTAETIGAAPAVELLVDRIRRVRPGFSLDDDNAAALGEICRRLDGLPLAIELAAARLRVLSPQDLLHRLEHRLDSLAAASPDAPDRHRTLRATIAWSHDHLSPDEQRVFRRLGVFAGGAGLEAVEAVCSDDDGVDSATVLDLVAGLVDKSLVVTGVDAAGRTRFRLLETIREFAVEALFEAGEVEATWDRHLAWHLGLAERAWDGFWTAAMRDWLLTVETEIDNLRSALDHAAGAGDPRMGLRIGAALWPFWDVRGHYREGAHRLAHLLERAPAAPSPERGRALSAQGWLVALLGDFESAMALIDEGLPQVRAGGTAQQLAWTLAEQANVAFSLGDADRSRDLFAESLAIAREMGDGFLTGMGLFGAAFVAFLDGDIDAMEEKLNESLELTRVVIQPWGIAWAEFSLGVVATMRAETDAAVEHLTCSLEFRWSIRDARGLAESLQLLASLESEKGEHEWSALLHGAAEMQRDANGLAILPFLEPLHEQSVQRITDALGADATARAWRLGRSMPMEKVVAEALSRSGPRAC